MLKCLHAAVHGRTIRCITPGVNEGKVKVLLRHNLFCILKRIHIDYFYLVTAGHLWENMTFEKSDYIGRQFNNRHRFNLFLHGRHVCVVAKAKTKCNNLSVSFLNSILAGVKVNRGQCHPFVAIFKNSREGELLGEKSKGWHFSVAIRKHHIVADNTTVGKIAFLFDFPASVFDFIESYIPVIRVVFILFCIKNTDGWGEIITDYDTVILIVKV